MECSCVIDMDIDGHAVKCLCDKWQKAKKQHRCCECYRTIQPGEKYKIEVNKYDDGLDSFKTCIDCMSVRSAMFCDFLYGEIWEAVGEQIRDDGIPESCLARITKPAREKICAMIEEQWDEEDENN